MFRTRLLYLFGGFAATLFLLFRTDPDHGISTGLLLISFCTGIIAVSFAHVARKALFDYKEADMRLLFAKAKESSTGAGLAILGLCIVIAALLLTFVSRANASEFIPANAQTYAPLLKQQQQLYWSDHPKPEVLAGLVEQESCTSLTHSKCWSPNAKLKTQREEGAGMGQITRAFNLNGTVRFDSLTGMRKQYKELAGWSWSNVYQRPDLQLRAIVLMSRSNYNSIHQLVKEPNNALAFSDAAYNGGLGGVKNDRRLCAMTRGCNPQQWFGNVEKTCAKSHKAIYGNRSACSINREHVLNVMLVRSHKYAQIMRA